MKYDRCNTEMISRRINVEGKPLDFIDSYCPKCREGRLKDSVTVVKDEVKK